MAGTNDPKSKLTNALTDINESLIDTFSNFPTAEAVELQIYDRLLGGLCGLEYYDEEADLTAEIMRSHERLSRHEALLGLYNSPEMFNNMVGFNSPLMTRDTIRGNGEAKQ